MWKFSPERRLFFFKNVLLSAEMLNMLDHVECLFQKMLLSAEMLNMLNLLNYFGSIWSLLAFHRPKIIQHIQHIQLFISRKKHIFSKIGSNMIQHIQHFSRKKHIWYTCWIIFPEIITFWAVLSFFPWKNHFLGHVEFFPQKEAFFFKNVLLSAEMLNMLDHVEYLFWKKVLLSAEMLNMLNMLNYFGSIWSFLAFHRPKIIQHIQHIQHFSRKKHIFRKLDPTWFNIFNISAERSTFDTHVELFPLK